MHLMYIIIFLFPQKLITDACISPRTFMTLKQPTLFFRALVLGAQGVFFNIFCTYASWPHDFVSPTFLVLAYMISPRSCHRFVGYLEEEAVMT